MTKNELKEKIQQAGLESAHLDDVVHDATSRLGSDANNGGLDSQLDFLIDTCGHDPENVWEELL